MNNAILNRYEPDFVTPPGDILVEKLEELGMSQAGLAERIGQLLGDDFVAILWDGKKHTKADYLDELRSGKYNVESITLDDTQARVLGDTAIVTYYQAEKSQSAGVDSSSGSAWTNVLAKRDGRWQVIAEHGSRFN